MELNLNLTLDESPEKTQETKARIKKAEKKVKAQKYEPTWKEVWVTGYTTHTGSRKKGIFQTNITSERDKERLIQVKEATENGEIPVGTPDSSLKKYTKAHALRMYKVLSEIRKEETIKKLMAHFPDNYYLINTEEALEKLIADLWKEEEIAIDTETTGLSYFETYEHSKDKIVGVSLTLPKADYHVYIPINHTSPGKQLNDLYVMKKLRPIIETDSIKKILFNAKFDIHMIKNNYGIRLGGFHFDGFIGMKLLNENEPSYKLKDLSTKYGKFFGFADKSQTYEELFGKGGYENAEFERDGKPYIGTLYPCKDTHLTYLFYKFIFKQFERLPKLKKLYLEVEKPILDVSVDMEQNGFLLDSTFAKAYSAKLKEEIVEIQKQLVKYFGDININSNQQLADTLYNKLGLPDVSKKQSVDKKTLTKLSNQHEGVKTLLKYRELNKLATTYIDPLPLKVSKDDKRLHGTFNQVDTATGRFASSSPNLQNLPYSARKMIIAPERKVIMGMDFSAIEPRVLSHMANDKNMMEAYIQGKDLYMHMASEVFNLPIEYCADGAYDPTETYQPRKRIKAILLGIMYGMGSYTLAGRIDSTVEAADKLIEDFFIKYPSVKAFIDMTHEEAVKQEFVETMFGRKRRFIGHRITSRQFKDVCRTIESMIGEVPKNIWKADLPYKLKQQYHELSKQVSVVNRQSVNTKIQGTAADIMKKGMIRVSNVCKKYGFKLLSTVHDEVLIEVPEDISIEIVNELETAMLGAVTLNVPLKTDIEFSYIWSIGVSKDEWFDGERPDRKLI